MTVSKEVDWIREEPEYIGPSDEMEFYFNALAQAADAARYGSDEDQELLAKMAFKQQADSILWIYQSGDEYEEYGLPEPPNTDWMSYDYGSPKALEFAWWAIENRDPEWRENLERRYLEERLARLKK